MGRLDGKVALISGGARGMGAEHARAMIREGGQAVIGDILDADGAALADELGPGIVYTHLDVTQMSDWQHAVDLAVRSFGKLNVLVNNAGIANFGPLGAFSQTAWSRILEINLTGPFLGITAARDALVAAAPASIVNIASTAGIVGAAAAHGYCASKFGLRGLTKSVALELAQAGVRCNSIHPGIIRTPLTEGLDVSVLVGPMGRMGEAAEVANLLIYLASDESSFSTGSEFIIDGGQTAGTPAVAPG